MDHEGKRAFAFLSHNVAYLRKQHGLSKKEMAALLGIGIYSLNKIERGELPQRLCVDILFHIHKHFGVRPSVVIGERLEE